MKGIADCGCFGTIKASPWHAFGVDVAAIVLLAIARPTLAKMELRKEAISTGKWGLGLAAVFALILGVGVAIYGSPAAALAKLRGDSLTVDRPHIDFGHGKAGDFFSQRVIVTNWTSAPLRIIGGTSDCSCITTSDLPITLAPGEAKSIAIEYRVPSTDRPGITSRTASLLTDCPKQPALALTLSASVD